MKEWIKKHQLELVVAVIVLLAMLIGVVGSSLWRTLNSDTPKQPKDITLSVQEVNKRIQDFTTQRQQLLSQMSEIKKILEQTPAQERAWIDSLKTGQRQWMSNAGTQIDQITVVLNTLNAIKADSSIRAK
jgi:hypothetical protein